MRKGRNVPAKSNPAFVDVSAIVSVAINPVLCLALQQLWNVEKALQ